MPLLSWIQNDSFLFISASLEIIFSNIFKVIQTIFLGVISMFIAIPLYALLYLMDKVVVDLTTTIKAIVILAHLPAHLFCFLVSSL